MRLSVFQIGDRILVRSLTLRGGPGKLRNFWEDEIHVKEMASWFMKGNLSLKKDNLLLSCDYLPSKPCEVLPQFMRHRVPTPYPRRKDGLPEQNQDSEDSDSENELPTIICHPTPQPRTVVSSPPQDVIVGVRMSIEQQLDKIGAGVPNGSTVQESDTGQVPLPV